MRWASPILLLLLAALPARAQQVLYDPVPPRGSAYVRFVNTTGTELALAPQFAPASRLGIQGAERVSPYGAVERVAGRALVLEVTAAGKASRLEFTAAPDSFLTVLLQPGADGAVVAQPVPDQPEFNQLRARLSFYNATACAEASLALEPGGAAVFQGVPARQVRTRSVNPVTAQLRAACGAEAAPPFALEGLEAGGMYSIWLMQPGGQPLAFVSRDTTRRYSQR